ncbi:hypothetical protein [Persephonella sp.]
MRILELVFDQYIKALKEENNIEIMSKNVKFHTDREEIKSIMEKIKEVKSKKTGDLIDKIFIESGNVYEYPTGNLPIIFTILEEKNNTIIALVMTPFWELASDRALIVEFNHPLSETFAVLPIILNLEEEFIKTKSIYLGKLNKEDFKILRDFYNGKIKELPEEKRGLSYPKGQNYYQELFLKYEIRRTFQLQMFMSDKSFHESYDEPDHESEHPHIPMYTLPTKKLQEQTLKSGEEELSYKGKNFTMFLNAKENRIEVVPSEDIIGKKAIIKIFDEEHEIESLPKELYLLIPDEFKFINLSYIGENISIEVKD